MTPQPFVLPLSAPLMFLRRSIQLSMDRIGHALRAVDAFKPDQDYRLPDGIIAALGGRRDVGAVPGLPIALQIGSPLPLDVLPEASRVCLAEKGIADIVSALGLFLVETDRMARAVQLVGSTATIPVSQMRELLSPDCPKARKFNRLPVPTKISGIRKTLGTPVDPELERLTKCILSVNHARNCLQHGGARVGPGDADGGTSPPALVVRWVALAFVAQAKDGSEKPARAGENVDALMVNALADRDRAFKVGEHIIFSAQEYAEICWTLGKFGESLSKSLDMYARRVAPQAMA